MRCGGRYGTKAWRGERYVVISSRSAPYWAPEVVPPVLSLPPLPVIYWCDVILLLKTIHNGHLIPYNVVTPTTNLEATIAKHCILAVQRIPCRKRISACITVDDVDSVDLGHIGTPFCCCWPVQCSVILARSQVMLIVLNSHYIWSHSSPFSVIASLF